jgi:hypothetical protein
LVILLKNMYSSLVHFWLLPHKIAHVIIQVDAFSTFRSVLHSYALVSEGLWTSENVVWLIHIQPLPTTEINQVSTQSTLHFFCSEHCDNLPLSSSPDLPYFSWFRLTGSSDVPTVCQSPSPRGHSHSTGTLGVGANGRPTHLPPSLRSSLNTLSPVFQCWVPPTLPYISNQICSTFLSKLQPGLRSLPP